jgi:hypothetical protein
MQMPSGKCEREGQPSSTSQTDTNASIPWLPPDVDGICAAAPCPSMPKAQTMTPPNLSYFVLRRWSSLAPAAAVRRKVQPNTLAPTCHSRTSQQRLDRILVRQPCHGSRGCVTPPVESSALGPAPAVRSFVSAAQVCEAVATPMMAT